MGKRTTTVAAVFGAVLMFFLGGNVPLFASMLGLRSRRFVLPSSMTGAVGGPPPVALAGVPPEVTASHAGGGGGRRARGAAATALLLSVLADDERALCSVRYPSGLVVTEEQVEYLHDQRYFLVITLRNNEELLHHALYELLNVVARLGPRNCFVSVFENNSKDRTPQFLALFTDVLALAGVPHHLVSTLTLHKELAAMRAAAAAAGGGVPSSAGGRRLLQEGEGREEGSSGSVQRERTPGAADSGVAQEEEEGQDGGALGWQEDDVESRVLDQLGLAPVDGGRVWWPADEEGEEEEGAREGGGAEDTIEGLRVEEGAAAGVNKGSAALAASHAALLARAASLGAAWRAAARAARGEGGGAAAAAPPEAPPAAATVDQPRVDDVGAERRADDEASAPLWAANVNGAASASGAHLGRRLAEASDISSDLAILTEGKWTGNRIEFLARVRNRSIRPMFAQKEQYDRIIIMNDAYFCAEDVLRLALHRDADLACGMDFDTTNNYGVGFYDTWVTKDARGQPFKKNAPYVDNVDDAERLRFGKPFPVFCCWNGMLVANAAPFYEGVRFRRGAPGECAASECSLFCKDFWRKGARNVLVDPHVRVAYDLPTWQELHAIKGMDLGSRFASNRSVVEWPEDIPWPLHPPKTVHCWGLAGNGRDPDQPIIQEELGLVA